MDDPKVIAALFSLLGTLVGGLVSLIIFSRTRNKEFEIRLLDSFKENLKEKKEYFDIYRIYADPLKEAAVSLQYRLEEILNEEQRAGFLLVKAPKTPYNTYKFVSTIYRLAAVLGWIRAYKKERSYLDPLDRTPVDNFENLVNILQSKLADGAEIENKRASELIKILVKGIKEEEITLNILKRIALSIEKEVDKYLGSGSELRISATELTTIEQENLCLACSVIIEKELQTNIPINIVKSRLEESIEILGIKEAWIFRDWQQAIGDFMLKDISGASRRFDVIGFREFVSRYQAIKSSEEDSDGQWINCIDALFLDLDVSKKSIFDARREQLHEVLTATKNLVNELNKANESFNADKAHLKKASVDKPVKL